MKIMKIRKQLTLKKGFMKQDNRDATARTEDLKLYYSELYMQEEMLEDGLLGREATSMPKSQGKIMNLRH